MQVNINLEGVRRKLSSTTLLQAQRSLASQAAADMNQFIPMDEGNLRMAMSIDIDGGGINYHMPYASRMFYMYMYNYSTPGTGPRWDIKAKSFFMRDWITAFTKGAGW